MNVGARHASPGVRRMLDVKAIQRSFGDKAVLRGISLAIAAGEIVCLLGASGSGKTTLLRIIAGLEQADAGDVLINGQSILSTPVHQRDFGLMFQDYALFPHMNVAQNVTFGLRMHGMAAGDQQRRLQEVLQLVGLAGFEKRDVAQLSGGEKQRVALARSLAPNPRLLLLDEPLGSLDAALRERLAVELREIIKQANLTAIHVTHDQQEAFAIADRVAILHNGQLEQLDTPQRLYRFPATVYVARFLGLNNIVPIIQRSGDTVETVFGTFNIPGQADAILLHPDGIKRAESGGVVGQVREAIFQGDNYKVLLAHTGGATLTFKLPADEMPAVGDQIRVDFTPERVIGLRA